MNRQEKEQAIQLVKHDFETSQATFIVAMQGMTVENIQKLRKELKQQEGSIKVTKNTLLKIATKDMPGLEGLAPFFREQVALVFAHKEPVAVAKLIFTTAQANEKLKLVGGALKSKVIDKRQIEFLATLPAREVVLAQALGTMKAPITAYVSVLNQLILKFLWVLNALEKQKQQ